jgi:hypothetical protein
VHAASTRIDGHNALIPGMLRIFLEGKMRLDAPKVTFGHCPPDQGYIPQKAYLNAGFGACKRLGFW